MLCELCMPEAFCGLETVRQKLRELCALCERKISPRLSSVFFFSQNNTEEQNTQRPTETLSQPITQSVTANLSWKASVNSVCRRRSVGSKLFAIMLCSLCVLCERKTYPHTPTMFFFSQNNTDEQNTQRPTETLSQPISQNLTPTFSYNVLWYLYAEGVLWVRNSAQKGSVKSVSSVREKLPSKSRNCSFSHRRTQMNRTHSIPQRH